MASITFIDAYMRVHVTIVGRKGFFQLVYFLILYNNEQRTGKPLLKTRKPALTAQECGFFDKVTIDLFSACLFQIGPGCVLSPRPLL